MAKQGSVGPSRSGDQFHYQWAARQCLGLLTGEDGLVAVAIEGASLDEGDISTSVGDEVIDVGLYYGSEEVTAATSIRYVQLKHSSRQAHTPWRASGLKGTIERFAGRFKELESSLGLDILANKIRFVFLTNRPMDGAVLEALADLAVGSTAPRHREIDELLKRYAASASNNVQSFFAAFSVEAGEPDLWEQRNLLSQDLSAYLSEPDTEAALQLKELVTRRATDEGAKNRSVRLYDVLRALRVSEIDLLPAPSLISEPKQVLPREQQAGILATLLSAQRPVVIHADGGVGKSTLSAHLARAMPAGSVAVLYDCFGDGTYRQSLKYRHRYRDALVQIANELSGQQLCLPLIPSGGTDPKQFMRAFVSRLKQAIDILRARTPQASLCIIVDAADNAYMAAHDIGEHAFVRDLISTDMPDGVRLAFTCRSHRRDYLGAPLDAIVIKLEPFSKAETATHLRMHYPEATNPEAADFAYLSSDNPRVQALAMEGTPPIGDMLRALGPTPMTVQSAIGGLLTKAIDRLKAEWGPTEANQIDLICKGLAVLRPLVPISILAQIAGVPESAVRTFATEFGRPLFVKDSGLHFMDEPAETWFNETFKPDAASLDAFLAKLKPLAATSAYVAAALPQLLLSADRMDELIALALSNESLPELNPLERRDVELQRMMFALRACLQQGQHVAAAKLALKLGGEVAGETRQNTLIQQNTDIASVLLAPDRIEEMVSRRTFGGGFLGSHHAYEAVLLAGSDDLIPEARSRLRMAWESLVAWSHLPTKCRKEDEIDVADIAELAIGVLRLRGSAEAAQFLKAWTPKSTVLRATKVVAARLADVGDFKGIDELAEHAEGDAWMLLGLATEAVWVAHLLPAEPLRHLMGILVDPKVKLPEEDHSWRSRGNVLGGVRSAITLALRCLPRDDAAWAEVLRRYLPKDPPHQFHTFDDERAEFIRAYALEAALRGKRIELIDLAPKDVRPEFETKGSPVKSQQASQLQQMTGGVLPWFILAAEIACGRQSPNLDDEVELALRHTKSASSRDYYRNFNLDKVVAIEWVLTIRDAGSIKPAQIDALLKWVDNNDRIYPSTLTRMCHVASRTAGMGDLSLQLSSKAFDHIIASRSDAEAQVNDLQELARAIFCVSKSEAAAYFDKAIEIASKLGEEHLYRWTTFLDLSHPAHHPGQAKPRTAYRLSRIAELTYEHMARDKYMDWDRLVESLVGLCPSSSLAILSRWRDRGFGLAGELFPVAIYSLIDRGLLPKKAAIAMSGTETGWERVSDIKAAIDSESDNNRKRSILQIAYRFLRIQTHKTSTWRELKVMADSLSISLPDLERLLKASVTKGAGESVTDTRVSQTVPRKEVQKPDWDAIFCSVDLCDSAAVAAARRSLKKVDGRSYASEFNEQGLRRAKLSEIDGYLRALQLDDEFSVFSFMDVIRHLPEASKKLLSVRNELRKAALLLAESEPNRVGRRGWGSKGPFDCLYLEGIIVEKGVASARISGYLSQFDGLDANDLFHLVEPLSQHLTSDEADEVLNFGFDLLEEILEDKDGDGPWNDSLAPSSSCEEALAGYLWAGLARPSTAERWEYAHCVRNCLELDWQSLLSALATRALGSDPQPFVDSGLLFYEWHARQWLCIALARGAMDVPGAVIPFLAFLDYCVREQHVVIRHFASDALRRLHEVHSLPSDLLAIANCANRAALPKDVYDHREYEIVDDYGTDDEGLDEDDRYFFGTDIGPHWFAPLGGVFGLNQQSIEQQARSVLCGRMSLGLHRRVDDQRYRRGIFRGEDTTHSHGSMPRVEDCVVYQSYHAMMFVAGQLLEAKPVRCHADEEEDPFDDWLDRQLLTRSDDRWLADRRDPEILKIAASSTDLSDDSWYWQVNRQYLDDQLTTDDGMSVLWGHWTTTDAINCETVSVSSVLVPSCHADAFIAAMQTSPSPGAIYLPSADDIDHRNDVNDPKLRLLGWVKSSSDSMNLDEYDPWAGEVAYPGPQPCQVILNALNAVTDPDARSWTLPDGGWARSESWSRITGYREKRDFLTGTRLSADNKFIHALLGGHPYTSLVVCVKVRRKPPKRKNGKDDYSFYNYPYNRYYLIGHDGITRSL
ncbi:AVAST type 3 anti-phage nuclease/ATPase Avs3a [Salinicola sp. RZ23]|uniref:AVAST type 3 anti-phage nuclease/ATPase Avs3a n=1 Tax=Salinicola sp. RZ23 TaxID=1949087 RepID=UPI000DA19DF6|nr:AVAST type 3 anti-phage nuclease/ATPase Avs3a [Salinicola sp. RZ23]